MKKTTQITKMLLLLLCILHFSGIAQTKYQNILIIHDAVGLPESAVVIDVDMQNYSPIMGLGFDVPLPSGFTYIAGSAALNPVRLVNHLIVAYTLPGTNIFRIVAGSNFGTAFLGNAGIVLSFMLNTPTQTGNYPLNLENCGMINASGSNVNTGWINGMVSIMQFMPAISGDSNCNGSVNITDIIAIINYLLGNNPQPFCFDNADVNGDGIVNLIDVIGTIDIIMN